MTIITEQSMLFEIKNRGLRVFKAVKENRVPWSIVVDHEISEDIIIGLPIDTLFILNPKQPKDQDLKLLTSVKLGGRSLLIVIAKRAFELFLEEI